MGLLDLERLRRALFEVVSRHGALRTVLIAVDGRPCPVVLPPAPVERAGARAPHGSCAPASAEDPIYVMLTSGSTGSPKAVVVPHRGVMNRFAWMDEAFSRASARRATSAVLTSRA